MVEKLKKRILALGALVEDRVRMALRSIESRDAQLAKEVIKMDYEIDETEVEVEEECLKILALHQPVAIDLRFLIAAIKMPQIHIIGAILGIFMVQIIILADHVSSLIFSAGNNQI